MPESRLPFLACQNCEERIALPLPTLEGKPTSQNRWPSDRWTRNFLCLRCGHVYVYTAPHVQWEIFRNQVQGPETSDVDVVWIETRCATEGCESRLRFHAVVETYPIQSSRTISVIAQAMFHGISCERGHPAIDKAGQTLGGVGIQTGRDDEWWTD
jgi:hypothetical protein